MGVKVTAIPATINKFTAQKVDTKTRRRVAGYARVSTDKDEQFSSYEAQVDYYTNYIKGHSDWIFVNVYTDEGITGTHTEHREGFKSMISDAKAGKIDLIVTKSISRFARNTVDSLVTIRDLKACGVECYFEKENIWTFDSKGELLITIMSSLAQEESRSISENISWGYKKRFADGKVCFAYSRFLGYDRGPDGNPVINEEQAKAVQFMFNEAAKGLTTGEIARRLNAKDIPTATGKAKWEACKVRSILTNEKYTGNAILQKTYKQDLLSKRRFNHGEVQKYYVENSHPAIVSKEIFDIVQQKISGSHKKTIKDNLDFSCKIKCSCGSFYSRKVWHSTDSHRKIVYQCQDKYKKKDEKHCTHLTEQEIIDSFMFAYNKVLQDKNAVLEDISAAEGLVFDTTALDEQKAQLINEVSTASQKMEEYTSSGKVLTTDDARALSSLEDEYLAVKAKLDEVESKLSDLGIRKGKMQLFAQAIKGLKNFCNKFRMDDFERTVDYIEIGLDRSVTVVFLGGVRIECPAIEERKNGRKAGNH